MPQVYLLLPKGKNKKDEDEDSSEWLSIASDEKGKEDDESTEVVIIDSEPETPKQVNPKPPHQLHVPIFYHEVEEVKRKCLESSDHYEEAKKFLSKPYSWLTQEFRKEIESLFPKEGDIQKGVRNVESLEHYAMLLFPPGRVFMCVRQVLEAAQFFGLRWAFNVSHTGGSIRCSYGESKGKKHEPHPDPDKRRSVSVSLKETVKCPFVIPYGHRGCGMNSKNKLPSVLYRCVIGQGVNYKHTCGCCPSSHRVIMQKVGNLTPDLAGLTSVLSLLRENPRMKNKYLRGYLMRHLPSRTQWDSKASCNFRAKAFKHSLQDRNLPLTPEDANDLLKAAEMKRVQPAFMEFEEIYDCPTMLHNFRDMWRKVLQDSNLVPDVEKYLDRVKSLVAGFDYRIQKHKTTGQFTGVTMMTPEMRQACLRYIAFTALDAQHAQRNLHGMIYLGVVAFDSNRRMRNLVEVLCIKENAETYAQTVEDMVDMEKAIDVKEMRIMFGD